jgi:V/A-type H+-transporting ATPase subunit B
MNNGIGADRTREDHRELSNQLYAFYAEGRDIRRLVSIVGEESLTEMDKRYLQFADEFEQQMVGQGDQDRAVEETLDLGWTLLAGIPESELKRVSRKLISRYLSDVMKDGVSSFV